jgi:beta-mannanase
MRQRTKSIFAEKRLLWQLATAILLIVFPLLMILFNSTRALNGIIWQVPSELKSSSQQDQQKTEEKSRIGKQTPEFGIYDPENKFSRSTCFSFEQLYFSWIDIDETTLQSKINKIINIKRIPVITIEPWNGKNDENTLLADIPKGKYDANIDKVIKILSHCSGRLFLSWGHEMDQDLTKRYPWSGKEPDLFVFAYKYVHDRINKSLKNGKIKWIWSPVAKKGCEKYWPGNDYADYIGMPIYSYPAWDKSYYGHIRSFKSWYEEKYNLVRPFHKPVIIVEFGVTGSSDYQTLWLQEAFESFNNFPSIETILFFYTKDTEGSWGKNFETPDWRADPETIIGLINWFNKSVQE